MAFVLPAMASGGMEQVTLTLLEAMSMRGYDADLVLERRQGGYLDRVPAGVDVIELTRSSKWRAYTRLIGACPREGIGQLLRMLWPGRQYLPIRRLASLVDYLRAARPAVLIAAHGRMPLLAIWAREIAATDTRVIVVEHSTLSRWLEIFRDRPDMHRRWQYRRDLAQRLYPRADAIAGVSNGVADDLARTAHIDRTRITTLYNPIVSPRLIASSETPVNHEWFAAGEPPVILAVGRLVREKNFADLIEAFALLRARQQARLMILGEGPERAALEARIDALGLGADIALPGWADNPYAYMRRSAIFVLCSLFEGLGLVLIEAMACGCPVVSTDSPSGPREILEDGRYGPLVAMHDPGALAKAMAATLDTPPDPVALRARADDFSVERGVAAYQQLIAQLTATAASVDRPPETSA
ncbi:group 1 glycosyl transferase [Salinisphaera sp. T5B8]